MKRIVRKPALMDKEDKPDLKRIQKICHDRGYKITLDDANGIWRDYSEAWAMTFSSLCDDDNVIFKRILNYGNIID